MEEQALHALKTLRKGKCIAILNSKSKEAKTNLFFPTTSLSPLFLKTLRIKTRGELYIFLAHEVASTFSFIFIGETYPLLQHMGKEKKQMCQGSCSMGFSLDHRSLKTSALDVERSFTCRWLVKLWQEVVNFKNEVDRKKTTRLFGAKFHTPSHIFLCIENAGGLQVQNGHTKLSMDFVKFVGCVMLCKDGDNFGALPLEATKAWALGKIFFF
ncbi:unnamed protein product [Sphagnum jensenii]|uniref:Uncharacterized protein n=1 Tax=Sphagnum jensenii TaxID=128206 RepID=A0ABP0WE85_9BRYO